MTATTAKNATCCECSAKLGRGFPCVWDKNDYVCDNEECRRNGRLCSKCYNTYPLVDASLSPDNDDDDDNENSPKYIDIHNAEIHRYCKACFQEHSVLDFNQTYETVGTLEDNKTVLLFVHGGASSRAMFRGHANELHKRFGYNSILLDLPGHGALFDDTSLPLTLDNCVETVKKVLNECGIGPESKTKVVYVGGSLGAYVGFYVLSKLKNQFCAAVMMDCGQNVGPDASLKARLGLTMLQVMVRTLSNAALMSAIMGVVKKSKADYMLVETSLGAGMFFNQTEAQVECLHSVAPAQYIPMFEFPILFMNGSEDHRDSEKKWLSLCVNKKSDLKVYEGGDHFFCHDSRFLDDIFTSIDTFIKNV